MLSVKVRLRGRGGDEKGVGGFNASTKSIDFGQPAQSAQADQSRYFLLSVNF